VAWEMLLAVAAEEHEEGGFGRVLLALVGGAALMALFVGGIAIAALVLRRRGLL
jgi:hypothetical protein